MKKAFLIIAIVVGAIGALAVVGVIIIIAIFIFGISSATHDQKVHVQAAQKHVTPLSGCTLSDSHTDGTPNLDVAYNIVLTYTCQEQTAGTIYNNLLTKAKQDGFSMSTTNAPDWSCDDDQSCSGTFSINGSNVYGTYTVPIHATGTDQLSSTDIESYLRTKPVSSYQVQLTGS